MRFATKYLRNTRIFFNCVDDHRIGGYGQAFEGFRRKLPGIVKLDTDMHVGAMQPVNELFIAWGRHKPRVMLDKNAVRLIPGEQGFDSFDIDAAVLPETVVPCPRPRYGRKHLLAESGRGVTLHVIADDQHLSAGLS